MARVVYWGEDQHQPAKVCPQLLPGFVHGRVIPCRREPTRPACRMHSDCRRPAEAKRGSSRMVWLSRSTELADGNKQTMQLSYWRTRRMSPARSRPPPRREAGQTKRNSPTERTCPRTRLYHGYMYSVPTYLFVAQLAFLLSSQHPSALHLQLFCQVRCLASFEYQNQLQRLTYGNMAHWRENGRGAPRQKRAGRRPEASGFITSTTPPPPLGRLIQTLISTDVAVEAAKYIDTARIEDCELVASYNWLDRAEPTILVPGIEPPDRGEGAGVPFRA